MKIGNQEIDPQVLYAAVLAGAYFRQAEQHVFSQEVNGRMCMRGLTTEECWAAAVRETEELFTTLQNAAPLEQIHHQELPLDPCRCGGDAAYSFDVANQDYMGLVVRCTMCGAHTKTLLIDRLVAVPPAQADQELAWAKEKIATSWNSGARIPE